GHQGGCQLRRTHGFIKPDGQNVFALLQGGGLYRVGTVPPHVSRAWKNDWSAIDLHQGYLFKNCAGFCLDEYFYPVDCLMNELFSQCSPSPASTIQTHVI
ncbi:MAG: hypothetical protein D4R39_02445, partial [Methylophilaceae bacterium]